LGGAKFKPKKIKSPTVDDLDRKWKDTNEKAAQKHEKLKV
jgi:hypothetical protein